MLNSHRYGTRLGTCRSLCCHLFHLGGQHGFLPRQTLRRGDAVPSSLVRLRCPLEPDPTKALISLIHRVSVIGEKSLRLAASVAESEGASATVYMYVTLPAEPLSPRHPLTRHAPRSLDVERVVEGTAYVHELWGAIFALVLASVIMWFQASFAVLSTIGIVLVFLAITGWAAAIVQRWQMLWMEATTGRVKFMVRGIGRQHEKGGCER